MRERILRGLLENGPLRRRLLSLLRALETPRPLDQAAAATAIAELVAVHGWRWELLLPAREAVRAAFQEDAHSQRGERSAP